MCQALSACSRNICLKNKYLQAECKGLYYNFREHKTHKQVLASKGLIPISSYVDTHGGVFQSFCLIILVEQMLIKEFSSKNLPCWIIEVHGFFGFVVGSHSEWNDFHRGEARSHNQDLSPMSGFIQVFLGLRVGHSCRVPAYNVEIGPCNHPGPAVPLDLENITYRTC